MKYFENVETLEELRKQYKELLKKYHPDNPNGSTQATQEINVEYDNLFKALKDRHERTTAQTNGTNKKDYNNMEYDFSEEEKLREVLQNIITLQNINIEIVGRWIWVDGNTYAHRNILKALGFKWAGEKKKWYFHTESFRKKTNKKLSMEDIRNYYGSTKVQTREVQKIKEA